MKLYRIDGFVYSFISISCHSVNSIRLHQLILANFMFSIVWPMYLLLWQMLLETDFPIFGFYLFGRHIFCVFGHFTTHKCIL